MKSLVAIAALAAASLAAPALGEPVRAQRAVSAAGLDLSTARGVRTLDLRILHAATALCGAPSSADARGRTAYARCRADARNTANVQRERMIVAARGGVEVAAK